MALIRNSFGMTKNKRRRIVENDLSNKFWKETWGSLFLLDDDSDN
jgi:hypothetical protein